MPRGYMPLLNNQAGNGTPGAAYTTSTEPYYSSNYWAKSSTVINPAAAPGRDYISVTPSIPGPGAAYYNLLNQGDEVKLFSLKIIKSFPDREGDRNYTLRTEPIQYSIKFENTSGQTIRDVHYQSYFKYSNRSIALQQYK